jgi:hypothetical protein
MVIQTFEVRVEAIANDTLHYFVVESLGRPEPVLFNVVGVEKRPEPVKVISCSPMETP